MNKQTSKKNTYHFVGIGGIGTSALAKYLHDAGHAVSGSDIREGEEVAALRARGIPVFIGHRSDNLGFAETVVYSNAVASRNPEVIRAKKEQRTLLQRSELLGRIVDEKLGIGIAGSHGKTTVSAMIFAILAEAGKEPSALIGGRFGKSENYCKGKSDLLVFEACEGYRSITHVAPKLACITNIDREHVDHYDSFDELKGAFVDFANRGKHLGCVLNGDDAGIREQLPNFSKNRLLFGRSPEADLRIVESHRNDDATLFTLRMPDGQSAPFRITLPGEHNVYNAAAAVGAAVTLDIALPTVQNALASFKTVSRRFDIVGRVSGRTVIDDYAHHPTEIENTLKAARQWAPKSRIVAVFQPHLFSRTAAFAVAIAEALTLADSVFLCPIYPAREAPVEGVTSALVEREWKRMGFTSYSCCAETDSPAEAVGAFSREDDLLLFMGAGDIHRSSRALLKGLSKAAER